MAAADGSEYFDVGLVGSESFARPSNAETLEADEEELRWAALARLPSQKRKNYALVRESVPEAEEEGESPGALIDVRKLSRAHRELVVRQALATNDQDNYKLLAAIKERLDRYLYLYIYIYMYMSSIFLFNFKMLFMKIHIYQIQVKFRFKLSLISKCLFMKIHIYRIQVKFRFNFKFKHGISCHMPKWYSVIYVHICIYH